MEDRTAKNPEIVGFACTYCTFKASEMAGSLRMKYPEGVKVIQVPCSSRVDPAFVIKAIFEGADGVFVAGCHPGDCHFIKGNYYTRRKIAALDHRGPYRLRRSELRRQTVTGLQPAATPPAPHTHLRLGVPFLAHFFTHRFTLGSRVQTEKTVSGPKFQVSS